jgi:phosphohistidine phosphatase
MKLYLMRHGIAEDRAPSGKDADRSLTQEGMQQTLAAARALAQLNLSFDLILASPYRRTQQTATILAGHLRLNKVLETCLELSSGRPAAGIIQKVATQAQRTRSMLLVGHEPDLSNLISIYILGRVEACISMKKGSLAHIFFPLAPTAGQGCLEWLLAPQQLLALGSTE